MNERLRQVLRALASDANGCGSGGGDGETGSALVEFAFVVMIMIMILAGVADYGMFLQAAFQMQEAAAAGAGYAAMPGNQDMSASANASATQYWSTYAQSGMVTQVSNFQVTTFNIWKCTPTGGTVSSSASCGSYGNPAEYVEVTTSGSMSSILIWPGIPSSMTLIGNAIYPVPWTTPCSC